MFKFKLYEQDNLYGLFYTFPKRGDGIGMHEHEEEQRHNVMVMRGLIEIYGPNRNWSMILKQGDVYTPRADSPHEIVALTDNAEILGLFIHGKPEGENLPEDQKQGEMYTKPVTHELEVTK